MCFSIIFQYNGNPLFPCFGNCMYFCIKRKISETLKFEMFVFSHTFPLLWEFTFLIFWELHGFLLHPKYLRNFEMSVFFPILFPYYENSLFPRFGNCMDFCIKQKISETLNFEVFVFSHTFPVLWKSTFPMC